MRKEVQWGVGACVVFAMVFTLCYWLYKEGYTQIYWRADQYGYAYLILSLPLVILLHDGYFYWTHLWSHKNKLYYKKFHSIHHRFTNPSAFSEISLHPVDAALIYGFFPLMLCLIPLHPVVLTAALICAGYANSIGHIGYELFSANACQHPIYRWINLPTAHNLHHSRNNCCYGLYFLFWDRARGTLYQGFKEEYAKTFLSEKAG